MPKTSDCFATSLEAGMKAGQKVGYCNSCDLLFHARKSQDLVRFANVELLHPYSLQQTVTNHCIDHPNSTPTQTHQPVNGPWAPAMVGVTAPYFARLILPRGRR